ncbi:MAG: hypothetical protein EA369_06175 [Bradymonadales bacterium]|nr:MAG: hypothetical protein EA369_06175 [Bradymonadales bacterium]
MKSTSQRKLIEFLSFWSLALIISGCASSKQEAMLDTIGSPQTRPATFNALEQDFRAAERDRVHLISPARYMAAQKSFSEARAIQSTGEPEKSFSGKLENARSELDAAIIFSRQNRDRMNPLINAREIALEFSDAEPANRELRNLETQYLSLVKDLDGRNSRNRALNRIPALTERYQNLTIKTLQEKHLGEATNNLRIAKNERADRLVPSTLAETEQTIKTAREFIALNANLESERRITQMGEEASTASRRLLNLTRQTASSRDLSPEDRALRTEAMMRTAGQDSERLQDELSGSERRLSEEQARSSELKTRSEDYASLERRLEQGDRKTQRFQKVQELFQEEDAEVSRQGDNLIIRLKKMNFEVNESNIPSQSFALLRRVQTAIQSFDDPSIVIEGHSDSTGDASLNMALSERRAQAVKEYFLSSEALRPERVAARGFGSERPLASNQSSAGRAINRRIDIVIKN